MKTSRRNFIIPATGLAALSTTPLNSLSNEVPCVKLPGCDIKMSRLGFGTGSIGFLTKQARWVKNNPKRKRTMENIEAINLFHRCYERGINFFDLADGYGTHGFCKEALKTIPREKVALMTKFWWADQSNSKSRSDWLKSIATLPINDRKKYVQKQIDRFLIELDTDYIDMLLLHLIFDSDWEEAMGPYMEVLSEYKDKGIIKTLGVSCHDYGAMETAVNCNWVDVLLARINPKGIRCDGTAEEVLKVLRQGKENNTFIIGMKIYGAGQLSGDREYCMKFAQECGVLDAITIGIENFEQIDNNLNLFAKYPKV